MTTIRLTWLGHATVLIEDQARLLTDPVLTSTLAHLHRRSGPLAAPGSAHLLDGVLISHLHLDHLHLPSLRLLQPGTPVLVPRGGGRLLRRLSVRPVEVRRGDVVEIGAARVHVVPAVHSAARWPVGRTRGEPVGYVVCGAGATYFAGDTSVFAGMRNLHPRLDAALLPVGGWGPWLRGEHMHPDDAASCLPMLTPRVAVPIHYGTFWPRGLSRLRSHVFHEPGRDFAAHAAEVAPAVDVRVLAPGSSTLVERGQPVRDATSG